MAELKKKIRYAVPHYKKVYSVFQYNQLQYMRIWGKIREYALLLNRSDLFFKVSSYSVLNACYIKENGQKKHLGDSKHIFRLKALYSIQSEIFKYGRCPVDNISKVRTLEWHQNGVYFYYDWQDVGIAEVSDTWQLSISERIKIHIELLRQLRQGKTIGKALDYVRREARQRISKGTN